MGDRVLQVDVRRGVVVAAMSASTEVRIGGVAALREQRPARWVPA
jgi:hypothetical protein